MLEQIQIMAQLLCSCRHVIFGSYLIFIFSLLLALLTKFTHWGMALICLSSILVLLLVQIYLHTRIRLDAAILQKLAERPAFELEQQTEQLDTALVTLGLISNHKQGRPWAQRLQGCLRLIRWHFAILVLQFCILLGLIVKGSFL